MVDDLHWSATTPSGPCSPTSRPRLIILPKKLVITFTQPAPVCLSHLQEVLQLATCPLLTYLLQSNASQTHQAHFILRTCQICQIVEHNFAGTKTRHIDQLFAKVHKWLRKLRKEGKCLSSVPKICASVSQGLQLGESDQSGKSESAPNAWIKKVKVIKTAWIIKKVKVIQMLELYKFLVTRISPGSAAATATMMNYPGHRRVSAASCCARLGGQKSRKLGAELDKVGLCGQKWTHRRLSLSSRHRQTIDGGQEESY